MNMKSGFFRCDLAVYEPGKGLVLNGRLVSGFIEIGMRLSGVANLHAHLNPDPTRQDKITNIGRTNRDEKEISIVMGSWGTDVGRIQKAVADAKNCLNLIFHEVSPDRMGGQMKVVINDVVYVPQVTTQPIDGVTDRDMVYLKRCPDDSAMVRAAKAIESYREHFHENQS